MNLIEISYTRPTYDAKAHRLHEDLKHTQHARDMQLQTAQIYAIEGDLTKQELTKIAEQFLCDTVIQKYQIMDSTEIKGHANSYVVDVWFKSGVTDTVGETVVRGIHTLGITKPVSVQTGDRYMFPIKNTTKAMVEEITQQLLANNVIQYHSIRKTS